MKRAIVILAIAFAPTAFAGLTYNVQSSTTGMRQVAISGKVTVDGPHMRMDIATGDKLLFNDNSIVLSSDGGKTMTVFDPSTKNYYEMRLDDVIGSATAALRNLPGGVKVSFDNPQVDVRDGGDGGTIEGFPTHKYVLDASYDVNIDAMGQKITSHLTMNTENWTTDQLSSEFSTFLQTKGLRTGVEALDLIIEKQSGMIKGMPIRQVSTIRVNQGGADITMVTTSSVNNVQRTTIDPSQFAMPAGYTKIDDPITKMMKQFKQ